MDNSLEKLLKANEVARDISVSYYSQAIDICSDKEKLREMILNLVIESDWDTTRPITEVSKELFSQPRFQDLHQYCAEGLAKAREAAQERLQREEEEKQRQRQMEQDKLLKSVAASVSAELATAPVASNSIPSENDEIDVPKNSDRVVAYIIEKRMKQPSIAKFQQNYRAIYNSLLMDVSCYIWGDERKNIDDQPLSEKEISYVGNTIYKRLKKHLPSELQPQPVQKFSDAGSKPVAQNTDADVKDQILEFLRNNRWKDYTYNEVAEHTGIHWMEMSKKLRELTMADEDLGVVLNERTYESKGKEEKRQGYQFVPEAQELRRSRRSKLLILCTFVEALLTDFPGLSSTQIRSECRRHLGGMDNAVVSDALVFMSLLDAIRTENKAHGKKAHYVNSNPDLRQQHRKYQELIRDERFSKYFSSLL